MSFIQSGFKRGAPGAINTGFFTKLRHPFFKPQDADSLPESGHPELHLLRGGIRHAIISALVTVAVAGSARQTPAQFRKFTGESPDISIPVTEITEEL